MRYRKNIVEWDDVKKLHNEVYKDMLAASKKVGARDPAASTAIVFAMAGPEIEFALVNDYGIDGWDMQKDVKVLLSFMDPVGVVGIGAGGSGASPWPQTFRTFKGHEWAAQHAEKIMAQAYESLPMYRYVGREEDEGAAKSAGV